MVKRFRIEGAGQKEVKWGQNDDAWSFLTSFYGILSGPRVYDFVGKWFSRLKQNPILQGIVIEKVVWLCIFIYSDSDLRESRFHFLHDCLHFLILILYHH